MKSATENHKGVVTQNAGDRFRTDFYFPCSIVHITALITTFQHGDVTNWKYAATTRVVTLGGRAATTHRAASRARLGEPVPPLWELALHSSSLSSYESKDVHCLT